METVRIRSRPQPKVEAPRARMRTRVLHREKRYEDAREVASAIFEGLETVDPTWAIRWCAENFEGLGNG